VYGIVFLGAPRAEAHTATHEAGWQMLGPMLLLAILCAAIGLAPGVIADPLQQVSLTVLPHLLRTTGLPLQALVPTTIVTLQGVALLVVIALCTTWYLRRLAGSPCGESATWGCGYQRPTARMQYGASSFAEMLTSLFAFVLKPLSHRPDNIAGLFPLRSRFSSHVPEAVLELLYIPALQRLYRRFSGVRKLQSGILQQYVLYSLVTLIVLLLASYL
jgi:hydrogenase-4 component B